MKPGMSRRARTEQAMATAMSTRGLGSVSYMSPEMKGATNYNPNEFTDVWSCAVAFCLMFAADLPPEDWALQQKRDPEYYKRWLTGHDLNPSPAFYEMFDQMFRVKFPSSREHMEVRMLWSTGLWVHFQVLRPLSAHWAPQTQVFLMGIIQLASYLIK